MREIWPIQQKLNGVVGSYSTFALVTTYRNKQVQLFVIH